MSFIYICIYIYILTLFKATADFIAIILLDPGKTLTKKLPAFTTSRWPSAFTTTAKSSTCITTSPTRHAGAASDLLSSTKIQITHIYIYG